MNENIKLLKLIKLLWVLIVFSIILISDFLYISHVALIAEKSLLLIFGAYSEKGK